MKKGFVILYEGTKGKLHREEDDLIWTFDISILKAQLMQQQMCVMYMSLFTLKGNFGVQANFFAAPNAL